MKSSGNVTLIHHCNICSYYFDGHVVPGIKSTKEENDKPHYALGVPPLHDTRGAGWCGLCSADAHVGHQAQQAGVTLPV